MNETRYAIAETEQEALNQLANGDNSFSLHVFKSLDSAARHRDRYFPKDKTFKVQISIEEVKLR